MPREMSTKTSNGDILLYFVLIYLTESDIDALRVKETNDETTRSELTKLNEQLSMLTDALQRTEDENVELVQQVKNLKEDIENKG